MVGLEFFVVNEAAGEFGFENVHMDVVVVLTIDEELVAGAAGFLEAALFIAATGTLVG